MQLDPVQAAVAVLASVLRGTPNDAHLDTLVNELDRLQGDEPVPARDHAAAEMAHRDDLARDVARLWVGSYAKHGALPGAGTRLLQALDRLAAAYLPDGPEDTPR